MSRHGAGELAFALVAVLVAVAVLGGVVLLMTGGLFHGDTTPAEPPAELAGPGTVAASRTSLPEPSATTAFVPVTGPNGIATVIPKGWQLKPCTVVDCQQADDPHSPARFLRLGATQAHGGRPIDEQLAYETEFSAGRANFQRVRMEAVTQHGFDAVDWEFEYDLNGARRHVKTLLWRANGMDNWVYASAELPLWPQTKDIYDRMVASSQP